MKLPLSRIGFLAVVTSAASFLSPAVRAAEYHVPSGPTPTLQDAIDDALVSGDPMETIYIEADLEVFAETVIPFGFNASHKLLIRPGTARPRATIRMQNCCDPVIHAVGTSYVTIQSLDIYRHITNNDHIVYYDMCSYMMIERCRIGSDWTVPGAANWSAIYWVYPFNSVIRNTMTFATAPSTFQCGIRIVNQSDPGSILRLYNNSIQGFYSGGIALQGTAGKVIVRNNVVVTEEAINPDPVGYLGDIGVGLNLVSSHNAVFCDAGDEWGGADDIRGANFVTLAFADIGPSFLSSTWSFDNPNPNFLKLAGGGPLHTPARFGQNLTGGFPDPDDIAVLEDWERNPRPAGTPPHTDRGADQSDSDQTSSVEAVIPGTPLSVEVRPTPARGRVEISLDAGDHEGPVAITLFDAGGRRVRDVWSGDLRGKSAMAWEDPGLPAGVYYLSATMGGRTQVRKLVLVP